MYNMKWSYLFLGLLCCGIMVCPQTVFGNTTTDQEVAKYLGVPTRDVQKLIQHEKLDEPQILIAAVIAKKRNQSLSNVIGNYKKYPNWERLSSYYHLEPDEIWAELKRYFPQVIWYPHVFLQQPDLLAQVLSIYLAEDQHKLLGIVHRENFSTVTAAILAKISGQKIEQILTLKKRMSWEEMKDRFHIRPARILLEQQRLKRILYQELER